MVNEGLGKCKRIMQLLMLKAKDNYVSYSDVRLVIFQVIGVSDISFTRYTKILKELGWLKRRNRYRYQIIENSFSDDF